MPKKILNKNQNYFEKILIKKSKKMPKKKIERKKIQQKFPKKNLK